MTDAQPILVSAPMRHQSAADSKPIEPWTAIGRKRTVCLAPNKSEADRAICGDCNLVRIRADPGYGLERNRADLLEDKFKDAYS